MLQISNVAKDLSTSGKNTISRQYTRIFLCHRDCRQLLSRAPALLYCILKRNVQPRPVGAEGILKWTVTAHAQPSKAKEIEASPAIFATDTFLSCLPSSNLILDLTTSVETCSMLHHTLTVLLALYFTPIISALNLPKPLNIINQLGVNTLTASNLQLRLRRLLYPHHSTINSSQILRLRKSHSETYP